MRNRHGIVTEPSRAFPSVPHRSRFPRKRPSLMSTRRCGTVTEILNPRRSVTGVCSARRRSVRADSVSPAMESIGTVTEILNPRRSVTGVCSARRRSARADSVSPRWEVSLRAEPSLRVFNTEGKIRAESACGAVIVHSRGSLPPQASSLPRGVRRDSGGVFSKYLQPFVDEHSPNPSSFNTINSSSTSHLATQFRVHTHQLLSRCNPQKYSSTSHHPNQFRVPPSFINGQPQKHPDK